MGRRRPFILFYFIILYNIILYFYSFPPFPPSFFLQAKPGVHCSKPRLSTVFLSPHAVVPYPATISGFCPPFLPHCTRCACRHATRAVCKRNRAGLLPLRASREQKATQARQGKLLSVRPACSQGRNKVGRFPTIHCPPTIFVCLASSSYSHSPSFSLSHSCASPADCHARPLPPFDPRASPSPALRIASKCDHRSRPASSLRRDASRRHNHTHAPSPPRSPCNSPRPPP